MQIKKLTDKGLKAIKATGERYEIATGDNYPGLFLRVSATGAISFWFRFQLEGTRRKMLVGNFPAISLHDLLTEYSTLSAHVKRGNDPLTMREQAKQDDEDNPTFKTFSERFIDHYVNVKLKKSTAKEYRRQINKILIPTWGKRRVVDIERKQITKLAESMSKDTPIMANRTLATIKKMFSYALDVGLVTANPTVGIKPPAKENIKDRVLNLNELATMIKVLDTQNNRDTTDILKLITLTAQRPGEVAEMRTSQLKEEVDGTWWNMAGDEVKNKTAHRVYLNEQALQIIQSRINDYGLDNYIFPITKRNGTISHMQKDVTVSRVRKIMPLIEAENIEKFTAHDLRRSAATGIAQLGHAAVVPDILNHKPQGITRQVYDRYSRQPEIKRALTQWGEAVQRAIDGTTADIVAIKGQQ